MPACTRICARDRAEVSSATSTSLIRLLAAEMFSDDVRMVFDTVVNRLPAAPSLARPAETD